MSETEKDSQATPGRLRKRLLWTFGSLTVLFFAILLLIPLGMQWGLEWWMTKKIGRPVEIEDIDFNPFTGRLQVHLFRHSVEEELFNLGEGGIDVDWWPMSQHRIYLPEINLRQVVLDVRREADGTLDFGGLRISPPEEVDPAPSPPEESGEPWGIGIGKLVLDRVKVHFQDPQLNVVVEIPRLELSELASWQPEQAAHLVGTLLINGGKTDLDLRVKLFAAPSNLSGTLRIDTLPLAWLQPLAAEQLTALDGNLSCDLNLEVSDFTIPDSLQAKIEGQTSLGNLALALNSPSYELQQQAFDWQGSLQFAATEQIEVGGELKIGNIRVTDLDKQLDLARIESLQVNSLQFQTPARVNTRDVLIEGASLLQTDQAAEEGLVAWQSLKIAGTALSDPRHLVLEQISFDGLQVQVTRTPKGEIAGSTWWTPAKDAEPAAPKKEEDATATDKAEPFQFALAGLDVGRESQVEFIDRSFDQPVEFNLAPLELTLGRLDAAQPDQETPLDFRTRFDKYSSLELKGRVKPLLKDPAVDLKGEIKNFDLPSVSPYARQSISYTISSGHLDSQFNLQIKDNHLDFASDLLLAQLEMAPFADAAKVGEAQGGGTVNIPINLLKDDNGDVELHLPVQGELDDPQFHLGPAIQSALAQAVQAAAVTYLAPLGVQLVTGVVLPPGTTWLAGALFDMMTKLNFDPAVFPAGSADPEAVADYLTTTAKLLQERPKLRLRLCGWAVAEDLQLLQQATLKTWQEEQKKGGKPATPPDYLQNPEAGLEHFREDLLQLARQRSEAVKDELVSDGDIDPGRLFLCEPALEMTAEAQPRVELAL